MGARTQALIGTMDGVATVRVYSANPKTSDGYNTFVAKFKADSEAPSLHGHLHIGESAFEQIYDNRFRLILQGVELYYQKMVEYAV